MRGVKLLRCQTHQRAIVLGGTWRFAEPANLIRVAKSPMSNTDIDPTFGWQEIADHRLILRGIEEDSGVTLVADTVLATPETIHDPAAIGFTAQISTSIPNGNLEHEIVGDFYGGLEELRSELVALRSGLRSEVEFSMVGLSLTIYRHERIHNALCVEGTCSSVIPQKRWPWPKTTDDLGNWLIDEKEGYCLQFAFMTSLGDQLGISEFISDIDELRSHLSLFKA